MVLITKPPNYVAVKRVCAGEYLTEDGGLLIRRLAQRWYVFLPYDRTHPLPILSTVEFMTLTDARKSITAMRGVH